MTCRLLPRYSIFSLCFFSIAFWGGVSAVSGYQSIDQACPMAECPSTEVDFDRSVLDGMLLLAQAKYYPPVNHGAQAPKIDRRALAPKMDHDSLAPKVDHEGLRGGFQPGAPAVPKTPGLTPQAPPSQSVALPAIIRNPSIFFGPSDYRAFDSARDMFKGYEFDKVISVLDKDKFIKAKNGVKIEFRPGETTGWWRKKRTQDRLEGKTIILTEKSEDYFNPPQPGNKSQWTIIHELIHAIEVDNKDYKNRPWFFREASKKIRDYDERNVEYIEEMLHNLNRLKAFEKGLEKIKQMEINGENISKPDEYQRLQERVLKSWNDYVDGYARILNHFKSLPVPPYDAKKMKDLFGFEVDIHKIHDYYRNNGPEHIREWFNNCRDCKVPPPQPKPKGPILKLPGEGGGLRAL